MPEVERADCPCSRARCERRGRCAECRMYHKGKRHPVWCERPNGGKVARKAAKGPADPA